LTGRVVCHVSDASQTSLRLQELRGPAAPIPSVVPRNGDTGTDAPVPKCALLKREEGSSNTVCNWNF
jgi:hypothetical protein